MVNFGCLTVADLPDLLVYDEEDSRLTARAAVAKSVSVDNDRILPVLYSLHAQGHWRRFRVFCTGTPFGSDISVQTVRNRVLPYVRTCTRVLELPEVFLGMRPEAAAVLVNESMENAGVVKFTCV